MGEAGGGEGFVELDFAGIDAESGGGGVFDDRFEFGFDAGECLETAVGFGGTEAEDGGRLAVGGEAIDRVGVGGDEVGEGVTLIEVVFAVVEGGDRDVAGDVVEGEEELLFGVVFEFGLEFGGDEPVVELGAGGFEGVEVAVGGADLLAEGLDGFVELLLGDVGDDDRFGVAASVGPEHPDFFVCD